MDTACFYTFSTISQTLAGAFGFLVAVVLYQMQTILSRLHAANLGHISKDHLKNYHGQLAKARILGNWSEIADVLEANPLPPPPPSPPPPPPSPDIPPDSPLYKSLEALSHQHELSYESYIKDARQITAIKSGLYGSLKKTGVTIGSSLILLALTPYIATSKSLTVVALAADVVAALYCLWTYFPLVRAVAA